MPGRGHVDDQAAPQQVGAERRGVDPVLEADADHQAAPARLAHAVERLEALAQLRAQLAHAAQQRRVVDDVEHGQRGGRGDRAAGEGRAVVAGLEHVGGDRAR